MTQEDKQLLLKDLSARLPYEVIVKDRNGIHKLTVGNTEFTDLFYSNKCNIKPYLRPMSSMTEDEKIEWDAEYAYNSKSYEYEEYLSKMIDWLNAHHFDYRSLIEKGLAIEVTKDNNSYEEH